MSDKHMSVDTEKLMEELNNVFKERQKQQTGTVEFGLGDVKELKKTITAIETFVIDILKHMRNDSKLCEEFAKTYFFVYTKFIDAGFDKNEALQMTIHLVNKTGNILGKNQHE